MHFHLPSFISFPSYELHTTTTAQKIISNTTTFNPLTHINS
ncbi:hypothetical protein MtrunA17_Chr5g0448041 [Medicago truncatula]|uniref:Uncharacterized protein n=1 Tax=Medicago truncatula TaxID=3880 RepID=A0A396I1V0_MEDTR|nr:hypothetical protein MtrunA17_Chr5g0448041 [Medicago truncatula]